MKKLNIVLLAGMLTALGAIYVIGSCGTSVLTADNNGYFVTGLTSTKANTRAQIWINGSAAAVNNGSFDMVNGAVTNSISYCGDGVGHVCLGTDFGAPWDDGSGTTYVFAADWFQTGYTSCPSNSGTARMVGYIEGSQGEGASGYVTRYNLGVSNAGDWGSGWEMDTGGGPSIAIPRPTITATANAGGGTYNITMTWPQPDTDGVNGPGTDIITGYTVFSRTALPAAPPTSGLASAWTSQTSVTNAACAAGTCTATLNGFPVNATNANWFAIRLNFEGGLTGLMVSQASNAVGPLGPTQSLSTANATYSSSAAKVTVNWATTSELGVTGFNVYWGASQTGSYSKVNSSLVATTGSGAGANYSYQFAKPATTASTIYVKVEAVKDTGSEWSAPIAVNLGSSIVSPITRPRKLDPTTPGTGSTPR